MTASTQHQVPHPSFSYSQVEPAVECEVNYNSGETTGGFDTYETHLKVEAMRQIFSRDLNISRSVAEPEHFRRVIPTQWQLPAGPFEDVVLYADPGNYACPVTRCTFVCSNEAEYQVHVGAYHLFPFICPLCSGDEQVAHYGIAEDVMVHLSDYHSVERGPSDCEFITVTSAVELVALSNSIFQCETDSREIDE